MNAKRYSSFSLKLAMAALVVVILVAIASIRLQYNQLIVKYDKLLAQADAYNLSIEKKQAMLDMPFNHEYVEKVAREKLGLCRPEEIIINNNLSE